MSKVFITSESEKDYRAAERFGALNFLTAQDLHNIRFSEHNERVIRAVADKLLSFDPETDYLVIGSNPYMAATVFMLLGLRQIRHVTILRWDNRDRDYIPLPIDIRREAVLS